MDAIMRRKKVGGKETANAQPAAEEPESAVEKTLVIIKPDGMAPSTVESILEQIKMNRFEITKRVKAWLTPDQVTQLYKQHEGQSFLPSLITYMTA